MSISGNGNLHVLVPTYLCLALFHLPWGQLWTLTKSCPLRNRPVLLRKDHPILSTTAYWHLNNQMYTTTKRQHAPIKHTCKKPILIAYTVKQECEGGRAGQSSTASKAEPPSVPPLSISSLINIGTGIYPTQPHNQPKPLRTIKQCHWVSI
jgi:hypothetical protein